MNGPVLTTSWDDGVPADLDVARLLAKYGFRGTFYATTGPSGQRTISDADLHEVVRLGHDLGNHGRSHTPFPELATDALLEELRWGESVLEPFGGGPPVVAPPRGLVSRRVVTTLNRAGYAVRMAPILGARSEPDGVIVPTAHFYPHSLTQTFRHLAGRRAVPHLAFLRAWIEGRATRRRFRGLVEAARSHSLVLHVWGHSDDLTKFDLWEDFEDILAEAARARFAAATNGELVRGRCAS